MRRIVVFSLALLVIAAWTAATQAQDKNLELKLVTKMDKVTLDTGNMTQAEYKKHLEDLVAKQKKKEELGTLPEAPKVDITLSIVNKGKEDVTIFVEGDANLMTLELKGPGVVSLKGLGAFTLEFRGSKAVTLAPGKSHDIKLTKLADGHRGAGRFLYWAEAGDYTLSASYQLAEKADGGRGPLLKSEPIKLKVEEKK